MTEKSAGACYPLIMPATFPTRRRFLQFLAASATALSVAPRAIAQQAAAKPNVLFIAIDDLNDWVGCLGGHPDTKTPHLDALAARGVNFTNAHCPAPLCNASRAALMTGVRPSTSGVYENPQPWRQSPALKNAVTIPQHFMAHGYTAMGSGKIYHGAFPDPPSWNDFAPSQQRNVFGNPNPPGRPLNGIPNAAHFDWGPVDVDDSAMGDTKTVQWVASQLAEKHDKPFFLACGLTRPHLPWYVPKKYFERFPLDKLRLPEVKEDDLKDVPEVARQIARPTGDHAKVIRHDQWRKAVQAYLAAVSFCDERIGQLMTAFDASPHRDDTIIVLWSDHGWHLGEKLHWRKFSLWEESTRNLLFIIAPGVTKPGTLCDAPVNLIDIYPTLIDLCGLSPPPKQIESTSLLPLLKDAKTAWDRPSLCTFRKGNHSLRSRRYRYTRYHDASEELYDHQTDPNEWTNLADRPEHEALKKELAKHFPSSNADPIPSRRGGAGEGE
jgi:arylsulfatase A-like enzyme